MRPFYKPTGSPPPSPKGSTAIQLLYFDRSTVYNSIGASIHLSAPALADHGGSILQQSRASMNTSVKIHRSTKINQWYSSRRNRAYKPTKALCFACLRSKGLVGGVVTIGVAPERVCRGMPDYMCIASRNYRFGNGRSEIYM